MANLMAGGVSGRTVSADINANPATSQIIEALEIARHEKKLPHHR